MTADYFAVFSLPRNFNLDSAALEKRYFEAQRQFHPDRLVGKSPAERQQAIAQSMLVNEAYQTLKSTLARARHLLALEGISPDSIKPSQKLLMEIMESREALAEAQDAATIQKLAKQNEEAEEDTVVALARAFASPDLNAAAELAMRLSYLVKIGEEIRGRAKFSAA